VTGCGAGEAERDRLIRAFRVSLPAGCLAWQMAELLSGRRWIKARPYAGWAPPCAGWRTRVCGGPEPAAVPAAPVLAEQPVSPQPTLISAAALPALAAPFALAGVATWHRLPVQTGSRPQFGYVYRECMDCMWARSRFK